MAPARNWPRPPAAASTPPASKSTGTCRKRASTSWSGWARPLPDAVLESVRRTKCALKAPITTPVGTGFRSINVHLRQALGLFACIRPCKHYQGVRTFFSDVPVDLVIVRENTEDLYAGIEFENGKPGNRRADRVHQQALAGPRKSRPPAAETGISIKPISVSGTERIVRCAFDYARANGRKKVTCVHKANIMKYTDGLFLDVARQRGRRVTRTSSSRTASSTTCACSSCRSPSCTTCWCCRTCTATSSATWRPAWSAAWAWRPARTSAPTAPSSKPPTAAPPSTRDRTRSTRRP